jgi:hypothetical protein
MRALNDPEHCRHTQTGMSTVTINKAIPLPPTPLAFDKLLTIAHAANPTLIECLDISQPDNVTYSVTFTMAHLFSELGMPRMSGVLEIGLVHDDHGTRYSLQGDREGLLASLTDLNIYIQNQPVPEATIHCTIDVPTGTPQIVVQALRRIFRQAAQNTAVGAASLCVHRDLNTE